MCSGAIRWTRCEEDVCLRCGWQALTHLCLYKCLQWVRLTTPHCTAGSGHMWPSNSSGNGRVPRELLSERRAAEETIPAYPLLLSSGPRSSWKLTFTTDGHHSLTSASHVALGSVNWWVLSRFRSSLFLMIGLHPVLAVLPATGVAKDWNPLLLSRRSQGTTLTFLWWRGTALAILLKMPARSLQGLLWRHVPRLHADGYLLFLLIDHADISTVSVRLWWSWGTI